MADPRGAAWATSKPSSFRAGALLCTPGMEDRSRRGLRSSRWGAPHDALQSIPDLAMKRSSFGAMPPLHIKTTWWLRAVFRVSPSTSSGHSQLGTAGAAVVFLPFLLPVVLARQSDDSLSGFLKFLSHHLLGDVDLAQFPSAIRPCLRAGQIRSTNFVVCSQNGSFRPYIFCRSSSIQELGLSVSRLVMERTLRSRGVHIGEWKIGDGAVLGSISQVPVSGISVKLFADDALTGYGKPWSQIGSSHAATVS